MVSVREKVAYGLGDTASNIIFQTVMLFLTFFYTDIFGIPAATVATLFLVVRIFDAVTDPMMGALTDRTSTRWGKFRPYLLWLALPFGAISVIAFTTPALPEDGKIIYAFVTYALLMAAYTAINIPYSALGGVLTADPKERVSVQSYRFVFGMLGGLIVTTLTLPMIDWLGDGNKAVGYQRTMLFMSIMGVIFFFICFFGTRERVAPPEQQRTRIGQDLVSLWKNDQWRILSIVVFVLLTGMVLRNSLAIYYVNQYLQREDLATWFITLGMIGNILGCASASPVARRFDKIQVYIAAQLTASLISAASIFIAPQQLVAAFVMHFLWCFSLQMATPLLWSKMADVVDYGHWKTGTRITGMVFSSVVFFLKLGVALGGALAAWLLSTYGYEAGNELTATTQRGILLSFTLYPAIAFLLVAGIMMFYSLTDEKLDRVQRELNKSSL